jgi:pyrroline-5-carboxylate reductase
MRARSRWWKVSPAARERLGARYPVHIATAPDAAMQRSDVVVLAVKPQDAKSALASIAVQQQLVISIAAGLTPADAVALARRSPQAGALHAEHARADRRRHRRPLRAAEVSAEEKSKAETILTAVGEAVWVPEERLLDPVTAVSASGPAYVFWMMEQLAASAEKLGYRRGCFEETGAPHHPRRGEAGSLEHGVARDAQEERHLQGRNHGGGAQRVRPGAARRALPARGRGGQPARTQLGDELGKRTGKGLDVRADRRLPGRSGIRLLRLHAAHALPFPVAARVVPQPGRANSCSPPPTRW